MTTPMLDGRRAQTHRRRQRVLAALRNTATNGGEISAAAIARAAGVHRTFLYRHPDLLQTIRTAQTTPPNPAAIHDAVTKASLRADLANADARAARKDRSIQQLERRLSDLLGEQVWASSGLGVPDDIAPLKQRIALLEERVLDLTDQLDEATQDLDAARASNRELITRLNLK